MSFRLNVSETLRAVRDPKAKKILAIYFNGLDESGFFADDSWKGSTSKQLQIKMSLSNINTAISRIPFAEPFGSVKGKFISFKVGDNKIKLMESGKYATQSTAISTQKQELAALWIIEKALSPGPKLYKSFNDIKRDKIGFDELLKIYPEIVDTKEWQSGLIKQQKTVNEKLRGAGHYKKFNRDGGFMEWISKLVKDEFGIQRKDTWNPADVWVIKNQPQIERELKTAAKGGLIRVNQTMIKMWKDRRLKGISLKAISGPAAKWEEVNLSEQQFEDIDDAVFELDLAELNLNLTGDKFGAQHSYVYVKEGGNRIMKFQVTQNSKGFNNLKVEGTPMGAMKARAGKVPLDMMKTMMGEYNIDGINFELGQFTNVWQNYPTSVEEYNRKSDTFLKMWKDIKDLGVVDSGITTEEEFAAGFSSAWTSQADIASSKLMQLAFVRSILKLEKKDRDEFITNITFLAQKKGREFGPFAKLY
tara:strand:- start:75 stop:1499 length:1425 start_codon:yes stop_codon:yes gene_type:complete